MTLLVIVTVSLIVTRIAMVALTLTGLSPEVARFQARSAFSGAGFTTAESETVVNHPVRRRIVLLLILMGNAGLVTAIASLLGSFLGADTTAALQRAVVLAAGLVGLWLLASSAFVNRTMERGIERALRRFTRLDVHDYVGLLRLTGAWRVAEVDVDDGGWLDGQRLVDLDLPEEGVRVLGIHRTDGRYVGAPRGTTRLVAGDTVVVYGREDVVAELGVRRRDAQGKRAHESAKAAHRAEMAEQDRAEEHDGTA